MQKKATIIIGLGYGDEGKGLTTDFLCNQVRQPLVIRFNGGHQAGHTVVTNDGTTHVFSSFSAGTFRNVPTYWSKYCTFSPAYLLYELDALSIIPKLYVDWFCPVTTHYDVLYNRKLEASRGSNRLGSCGVGFGATIDRHFLDGVKFYAGELSTPSIIEKRLKQIRAYYELKFERKIRHSFTAFQHDIEDKKFCQDVEEFQSLVARRLVIFTTAKKIFSNKEWHNYVFEGAQGILLDQRFGLRPYITKSNTTSQNALTIIKENTDLKTEHISVFYVSRCYLTRHGGGPFHEFPKDYSLKNVKYETNIFNEHQGRFRCGCLDLDLMKYSMSCDEAFSNSIGKNLIITCLDQLPGDTIPYWNNNNQQTVSLNQLPHLLNKNFQSILYSYHPCSDHITGSY